ncbi:MAG: hypothetical protein J6Y62_02360 [Clostridia bacterium]|nr:hypothetical protein [Clostridia bacterium]
MKIQELREKANEAVKNAGWKKNQVSVSVRWAGYEKVVVATIRVPGIAEREVKAVLDQFRDVEYDHNGCGDILAGGNTFVRVESRIKVQMPEEILKGVESGKDFKFGKLLITFDQWDHSVDVRVPREYAGETIYEPVKSIYNYGNRATAELVWAAIQENAVKAA